MIDNTPRGKELERLIQEQLPPQPSQGDVWLLVLKDMEERRKHGIEKYGVPVQPDNGRDPLVDAYQEALDLCVYLRQAIEERALLSVKVESILNDALSPNIDTVRFRQNYPEEWKKQLMTSILGVI